MRRRTYSFDAILKLYCPTPLPHWDNSMLPIQVEESQKPISLSNVVTYKSIATNTIQWSDPKVPSKIFASKPQSSPKSDQIPVKLTQGACPSDFFPFHRAFPVISAAFDYLLPIQPGYLDHKEPISETFRPQQQNIQFKVGAPLVANPFSVTMDRSPPAISRTISAPSGFTDIKRSKSEKKSEKAAQNSNSEKAAVELTSDSVINDWAGGSKQKSAHTSFADLLSEKPKVPQVAESQIHNQVQFQQPVKAASRPKEIPPWQIVVPPITLLKDKREAPSPSQIVVPPKFISQPPRPTSTGRVERESISEEDFPSLSSLRKKSPEVQGWNHRR